MRTTVTTYSCDAEGCEKRTHFDSDDFPRGYLPLGWRSTSRRGSEGKIKHWCAQHSAQAEAEFQKYA